MPADNHKGSSGTAHFTLLLQALQQVMALISERGGPAKPGTAEAAAASLLDSMELPPPPGPAPRTARKEERRNERSREQERERALESDFARERERERLAASAAVREAEAAYQDLLKRVDRAERWVLFKGSVRA